MKTSTALGLTFGAIVLAVAGLFVQAWILGIILPWFSVSLTFWQNFLIIILANMIFGNTGGSSK
jgi:pyruvate/2-oxoacid:ferredoxin oxidoreductase beta subunit